MDNITKVVINTCFGGFGLSEQAINLYLSTTGKEDDDNFFCREIPRDDPALVKIVESLGKAANGRAAKLKVVEVPSDAKWYIHDYDGAEAVYEEHRIWS